MHTASNSNSTVHRSETIVRLLQFPKCTVELARLLHLYRTLAVVWRTSIVVPCQTQRGQVYPFSQRLSCHHLSAPAVVVDRLHTYFVGPRHRRGSRFPARDSRCQRRARPTRRVVCPSRPRSVATATCYPTTCPFSSQWCSLCLHCEPFENRDTPWP